MTLKHWQATACVAMTLVSLAVPQGWAQQQTTAPAAAAPAPAPANPQANEQQTFATGTQQNGAEQTGQQVSATKPAAPAPVENDTTGNPNLPQAPPPTLTEPFYLRPTGEDYAHGQGFFPNPLNLYKPREYPEVRLSNSPKLDDLMVGGKIYLSLPDAVTLALENNYDIAIQRINLDIADTDIERAKAGSALLGVSTGLVTNTLGGTTTTITGGGGPGGTTAAAGGASAGASGLVLTTNGGGPTPENMDPYLGGTLEFERATTPGISAYEPTATTNDFTGNFTYNQGFSTGTALQVGFNNTRETSTSPFTTYSPLLNTTLTATVTQHLLQGCCIWLNRRFIIQAKNDRRIADSAFRQQLIYTIGQVESIYWALVSAYEDEQAKERALQQSTQLAADDRKQLQIGTLAPLDVVNADSAVSSDQQALVTSKTNLEYQQLLMKQAIARNLNDPQLANAPVVPTDRVSLARLPEEDEPVEDLVREAYQNNPQIEQAVLAMKNNRITIRAEKNGLLPTVDAFGFYGTSAVGGAPNPNAVSLGGTTTTTAGVPSGYGGVLQNVFGADYPNYGVGVNLNIPLRNRTAQSEQIRSEMEYRQEQMRLQQLYTQIRIQVINGVYALTNDRSAVVAAQSAQGYAAQSLEAEQKKLRLGASTTANVLEQERNLATAEDNLISADAAYARDRSSLRQILSDTLNVYNIDLVSAAQGTVNTPPTIPGLTAPQAPQPPKPLTNNVGPVPQMPQ